MFCIRILDESLLLNSKPNQLYCIGFQYLREFFNQFLAHMYEFLNCFYKLGLNTRIISTLSGIISNLITTTSIPYFGIAYISIKLALYIASPKNIISVRKFKDNYMHLVSFVLKCLCALILITCQYCALKPMSLLINNEMVYYISAIIIMVNLISTILNLFKGLELFQNMFDEDGRLNDYFVLQGAFKMMAISSMASILDRLQRFVNFTYFFAIIPTAILFYQCIFLFCWFIIRTFNVQNNKRNQ